MNGGGVPRIVEQIIRPTGLVDPEVEVRPIKGQIDDLLAEIREVTKRNERVLITTLTIKMAEDLTDYLAEMGVKVRYLHSQIDTLERIEIIRDLRLGVFDVLVGINLLREGLDLPEVSLIAILDADKGGLPPFRNRVDSDHWAGCPERQRPGDRVCRSHHRFHAAGHR